MARVPTAIEGGAMDRISVAIAGGVLHRIAIGIASAIEAESERFRCIVRGGKYMHRHACKRKVVAVPEIAQVNCVFYGA